MSYAFSSTDLKFVVSAVNSQSGNLRTVFTSSMFPDHYIVTECSLISVTVDQENHAFDMGYFQMRGPIFYVRKHSFRIEDLEDSLDENRYTVRIPL